MQLYKYEQSSRRDWGCWIRPHRRSIIFLPQVHVWKSCNPVRALSDPVLNNISYKNTFHRIRWFIANVFNAFVRGEIVEPAWQQKPVIRCFHIVVSCWKVAEVSQEATFTDVTLPPSRLLLLRRCKRGFWLHKTEINVENRSKQLTFSRTSLFNLLHSRLPENLQWC